MLKLPTRQTAPQSAKTLWKNANLKVRDFLNSMCFSGPSFLGMLIFYLVPFGVVIYYSFIAGVVDNSFVGLKNYIAVFNNAAFRTAAKNTAVFTGLAVPLAVVLSMLLLPVVALVSSLAAGRSDSRYKYLVPLVFPAAVLCTPLRSWFGGMYLVLFITVPALLGLVIGLILYRSRKKE